MALSGANAVPTSAPTPAARPSAGEPALPAFAPVDAGADAAAVFADLAATHALTQIVIDRSLPPEVVQKRLRAVAQTERRGRARDADGPRSSRCGGAFGRDGGIGDRGGNDHPEERFAV